MSDIKKVVGKPAKAESAKWDGDYAAFPAEWRATDMFYTEGDVLMVRTNRGITPCYLGEYVIRRTTRDFYPVDEVTYNERWAEQ